MNAVTIGMLVVVLAVFAAAAFGLYRMNRSGGCCSTKCSGCSRNCNGHGKPGHKE